MASIIRSLVSMVSKEEGDSISEDEQPQQPQETATSLDRQISSSTNDNTTNNDDTPKPKSKSKKDKATKKAEKKAMKKAKKKAAKRLEKEERKRLKKEGKRLKKEARKLEKRKSSANKGSGGNDMDVDIDSSIDETNSAISTIDSNKQSQTKTTYITTSNTNQSQILQLIPNHIKSNFRTIGFSKWGGNKDSGKGNWLPILELGPFDVEEGPVRDCWFELAEQAQETGRKMSKLVFWYGVKYEDRAQAYSFVSENKVISYDQGKLQGYNILPSRIANKLNKKQKLTKIEEQIHRGLREVELDVKKDKIDRGLLWLSTSKKQVYKIGTIVSKKFFDEEVGKIRPFAGIVERYDAKKKIYHILYEDGDTDMLYELEVKEILAKDGDKKLPAAKTIQQYVIGTKVSKSFFDEELGEVRPFAGSVVSFDAKKKYYKVVYEDGDAEDLWASDIKDILVKDNTPAKRSTKKRKAVDSEEVVETTPGRRKLPGGYERKTCLEEGCTNYTQRGGYCIKHGKKEGFRRVR